MAELTYKSAGVDLDLYREAMAKLPRLMRRTYTPRVIDRPGGFAGLFRLDYNSRLFARNYREPVLVAGTDGVGTKLKVAMQADALESVGIDLVAMCVNDLLCTGAEPLFFLDYLALDRDDPQRIARLVKGISDGCVEAEAALIGGETAILPDLYAPGEFDMAGFAVGVVERRKLVDGRMIRPGDVVLGLASSGFHSNGYSLIRRVVFEHAGLDLESWVADLERSVQDVLLEPTRIYVRSVLDVIGHYRVKTVIRGMAHITGGGLAENIERILPPSRRVVIDRRAWPLPPEFQWLQSLGSIEDAEMFRVFNMGIGYVLILKPFFAESVQRRLSQHRIDSWILGEVCEGPRGVEIVD